MRIEKLYKGSDARRMASTMLQIRAEQGEVIPVPHGVRKMKTLPANVLASYASRPARYRNVVLTSAENGCITLRMGGAR